MTTIYLILAVFCGLSTFAVVVAVIALKKCEDDKCVLSQDIERCKQDIESLAKCHKKKLYSPLFSTHFITEYTHEYGKAKTKTADNVTLEELAKLVLDGTPIVRDVPTKTKYGVHKDEDDGKEE